MGRGDGDIESSIVGGLRKQVGRDIDGTPLKLGDTDSGGVRVGFIAPDGSCWESVKEHDNIMTLSAFIEDMRYWKNSGSSPDEEPDAREIADEVCFDEENIEEAAEAAEAGWQEEFLKTGQEIVSYPEDFRQETVILSEPRQPLGESEDALSYPSRIKGGEIIVSREGDSWLATLDITVGPDAYRISLEAGAPDQEDAYNKAVGLEQVLLDGILSEEEVNLDVIGESLSPEEEINYAEEITRQGKNHPDIILLQKMGLDAEGTIAKAKQIAEGGLEEKTLTLLETKIDLPEFGETVVYASGEGKEDTLKRIRRVLPGAKI